MLIEDSTNVVVDAIYDDGSYSGTFNPADDADQSAHLVITGTSSGVQIKNMDFSSGAGKASYPVPPSDPALGW